MRLCFYDMMEDGFKYLSSGSRIYGLFYHDYRGMSFSLTKATCKEFEKQFAKKRLERAGGKPSDADVDAEIAKMREALAQCKKVGPKTVGLIRQGKG